MSKCLVFRSHLLVSTSGFPRFQVLTRTETHLELNAFRRRAPNTALVILGSSLETCLQYYAVEFVELACQCPAVVVCRCSPTQKARIVKLLRSHTKKRICAVGRSPPVSRAHSHRSPFRDRCFAPIWHHPCCCYVAGDGGNDVSMIQAADCGIGIVGKVGAFWPSCFLTIFRAVFFGAIQIRGNPFPGQSVV